MDLDEMKAESKERIEEAKAWAWLTWDRWKWVIYTAGALVLLFTAVAVSAASQLPPLSGKEPGIARAESPDGKTQLYMLNDMCNEPGVRKFFEAEIGKKEAAELMKQLKQSVIVEGGRVQIQGCYRWVRLGSAEGPVVGAMILWSNGNVAEIPLIQFSELEAHEVPKVVRERDGTA